MPQETFIFYGGKPRVRWAIAIIAINEPAWFLDLDQVTIQWHQNPMLANTWPIKEHAGDWLWKMKAGHYDHDMEMGDYAWAIGQEYRLVKISITEKYEVKVV